MKQFLILLSLFCLGQNINLVAQDTTGEEKNEIPIKIPNINDEETIQFSPTISADGTILIFQSENADGKWQLYQTTKDKNGSWSKPTPINEINDALSFVAGPNIRGPKMGILEPVQTFGGPKRAFWSRCNT